MYNCLIIGAGNKGCRADIPNGPNHYKYLSYAHAITDNPNTKLLGVMDIYDLKAIYAATEIWDCEWFKINQEIDEKIDIVIIATNDNQHEKGLIQALTYNPKLVICEKPVFENIRIGQNILRQYNKRNIPILVNYTRRYIKEFQTMKKNIDAEFYGGFVKGYCYFNGGIYHTLSHFVDMCNWFGLDFSKIYIEEIDVNYKYIYQWALIFENDFLIEHVKKDQINSIYDNNTMEVINNACGHLLNGDSLICSERSAFESLILTKNMIINRGKNEN